MKYGRKKFMVILMMAFIIALADVTACFADFPVTGPADTGIPEEMMMEGVSSSMLNASFWTTYPGGDTLLMTEKEIAALNEDCLDNASCNMNRLSSLDPVFDGVKLRKNLASFSDPTDLYLNGSPVPASFYEAIRRNIAGASVSSSMNVGYAFCCKRCVMRSLPESEPLSDDQTDPEWDNLADTAVLYNEPVVSYLQTADGRFTYVKSVCCEGWVPSDCIVLCHSKEEWEAARDPERFLIVTGDRVQTEKSYVPEHSELTLEMGVKLGICYEGEQTVDNRMNWYNYVVYAPGRGADGLYEAQKMLIPAGSDVHIGYMAMTAKNIIGQAFKSLGTRYGWGGSEEAQDCSSFVREVYLCFGLCLPRNTTWQAAVNCEVTDLSGMTAAEKKRVLDSLPVGTILQFPGHEMLYLGHKGDKYYTINNVSSLAKDTADGLKKIRARNVVINSLEDTKRANGKTWFSELSKAIVVFR